MVVVHLEDLSDDQLRDFMSQIEETEIYLGMVECKYIEKKLEDEFGDCPKEHPTPIE